MSKADEKEHMRPSQEPIANGAARGFAWPGLTARYWLQQHSDVVNYAASYAAYETKLDQF